MILMHILSLKGDDMIRINDTFYEIAEWFSKSNELPNTNCDLNVDGDLKVNGHLCPNSDGVYDLGNSSGPLEWRNLYIDGTAYVDTLSMGGDIYTRNS